jgi:fructokinase
LHALFRTTRGRRFFDINLRDPWVREDVLRWSLYRADVVKMNGEELQRVGDMLGLGRAPREVLGERLLRAFDLQKLLVTEGEAGAWLLQEDGSHHHTSPGEPLDRQVDSVGAGDGFAAVFLLGLLLGWPVNLTLDRAHRFAGSICQLRGAVPESADHYRAYLRAWQLSDGEPA